MQRFFAEIVALKSLAAFSKNDPKPTKISTLSFSIQVSQKVFTGIVKQVVMCLALSNLRFRLFCKV